ncbi:MAG: zinc-ribbon domain-containing protein [Myxococcales bacterium]|nr:zinc-ribbon domain-containing protein [Myxococcales bacterium]
MTCFSCGRALQPGVRFCGMCGQRQAPPPDRSQPARRSASCASARRRSAGGARSRS